jgi:hypothetical protein
VHIADDTRKRRQQQVQAMMRDITNDVPDAATDTLSYEDRLLCFQDAREAPRALWHWQEIDTATCSTENTGHDALGDTPFITDSFLGVLAESAPQDQHVRAPVDTAQAPLAIFFTREDIPSSSPTPPPAFEDAHTARGSVDTPPSRPSRLRTRGPCTDHFWHHQRSRYSRRHGVRRFQY